MQLRPHLHQVWTIVVRGGNPNRVGCLQGTRKLGSHKISDIKGNLEENVHFVTFIAVCTAFWGEIS